MVTGGISPEARAERIAELDRRAQREAEGRRLTERPPFLSTCRHEAAHATAAVFFDVPIRFVEADDRGGLTSVARREPESREAAVRWVALLLCGPAYGGEEPQSNIAAWLEDEPVGLDLDLAVQVADRYSEDAEDGHRLFAEGRALANDLVADKEFRATVEFLALELAERRYIAGPTCEWLLRAEVAATC